MRLTPKEPKIKIGVDGFAEHDQLGREDTGYKLSRLVEKLESPTVIALDGSWGSGKSFFLKCWCGEHMKNGAYNAEVIYFDAFEHDFLDDPLASLIARLGETQEPSKMQKVKTALFRFGKPAARVALAVTTAGASEATAALGDALIGKSAEEIEKLSEKFWERETSKLAAMHDFCLALTALTEPNDDGEPTKKLVIIIDELDRCRPDYALSMLEVMKHFFAVDGVHFVLGVNLKELENSVKARYGQGIDAARYLQKFVHVEIPIEKPRDEFGDPADYSVYFSKVAEEVGLNRHHLYRDTVRQFLDMINYHEKVSLRDVERIATTCAITGSISRHGRHEHFLMAGLIVLSVTKPEFITSARKNSLKYADIDAYFCLEAQTQTGFRQKARIIWKLATLEKNSNLGLSGADGELLSGMPYKNDIQGSLPGLISDCLDAFKLP